MNKCPLPSTTFVRLEGEEIEQTVHGRFERIVGQYSERLALKMGERALTYNELNRAANRIARAVIDQRGLGSEPVVLLLEHGIDVIAAIFGVLKAKKFYTVIDPSFPSDRVSYIINDSQAKLIVTNNRNIEVALKQADNRRSLLNIDEIQDFLSEENLGLFISPDDLVLIGYTSGSTGVPKGVVATHGIVTQTTRSAAERMHICVDDRLTLLHSLGFGSGHGHLYVSLLNGASAFPFDVKSEGIDRLAQWLLEEKITIYHSSPSLFRQLAEPLAERAKISHVRLVHLSGAPINRLDFDLYKNNFGSETLLEFGMGSTEARGICSATVDRSFSFPEEGTPIGYPRQHNKILLLDENGVEVARGEIGEIAVKGHNLSLGYWNNRDSIETKFQAAETSGERIFLTGDLGRMLPDGFIIHLGRKDLMIKIRGYRVELGEIEKALLAHPKVKDAGVAAWDCEPGEKFLVAYVVATSDSPISVSNLREFLSNKLPDYMVPSAFVFLDSLPLTNGKLDRKALPKPENKRPELQQPCVSPRNGVEDNLVRIWQEVLQVSPIGINDHFLDLGGHSLAATRVISRVIDEFQLNVRVKDLFDSPTVADMALIITQNRAKAASNGELGRMLAEVEAMSEAEAERRLIGKNHK